MSKRLAKFTIGVTAWTILVIVWGAVTRLTFSGDGCGVHWPLCNGALVPFGQPNEAWIEWFHRLTSGLVGPMVLAVIVWCYRASAKGSPLRWAGLATLFFTLTEGWVGRKLVLKELVAGNASVERAIWGGIHMVNTFMLLASLTMVIWFASGRPAPKLRAQNSVAWALLLGLLGITAMSVTGAVSALAGMVSETTSIAQGIRQDLNPDSHFLVRMRWIHPLISTSVGLLLIAITNYVRKVRPSEDLDRLGKIVVGLFLGQMVLGAVNLILLRPMSLTLIHLVLADALWIAFLFTASQALRPDAPRLELVSGELTVSETQSSSESPEPVQNEPVMVPMWKAYIALTKPRVISLLLFTTITTAFFAKAGWPGFGVLFALFVGGYCAAGSANAINMVYDRDIDFKMKRTSERPTVTQQISTKNALLFAFILEAISFGLLTYFCNVLTASLALAGLLFYVFIYTMMLKRRTWQNIVIGGAAGAFPPLVGYAGVTGELTPLAWVLFGIIFLWTPVHFWALALVIQDDYRDAGIPMLPVVRGERATVIQIGVYTILTAVSSLFPMFMGESGWIYLIVALGLNGVLFVQAFQLLHTPDRPHALKLFHYSMVYLAALFLVMAVDKAWRIG